MVKRPWPFFLVITALIVWSHLCESCYGFLRPFFNKMSKKYGFATGRLVWELLRVFTAFFNKMLKKYGFATGRTAMFFWFDHFFVITGKNNILPTKINHYGFFPWWPANFVFLAFQVYIYINIYIDVYNHLGTGIQGFQSTNPHHLPPIFSD